jgi:hypothetical protein
MLLISKADPAAQVFMLQVHDAFIKLESGQYRASVVKVESSIDSQRTRSLKDSK